VTEQSSEKPYPRVLVGMPRERTMPNCGHVSMLRIAQRGYPIIDLPYSRTDVARNKFAEHLLDSDFTHLLMLDCDHDHPDDIVTRLARWVADDPCKLVVAGKVRRRGAPYELLMFLPDGDGAYYSPANLPPGLIKVVNEHGAGYVATSAILIAREVFETIPWPWFKYEYPEPGQYPTEDIWFSRQCGEYGIDIWMDTTFISPHMTEEYVTDDTYDEYVKRHPDVVQAIKETEVTHGS